MDTDYLKLLEMKKENTLYFEDKKKYFVKSRPVNYDRFGEAGAGGAGYLSA